MFRIGYFSVVSLECLEVNAESRPFTLSAEFPEMLSDVP
jgi:hypothetical protein